MYKVVIFLVFLMFFILNIYNVSANFACGEVNSGNYSADWLSVSLNYKQSPALKTGCDVSPSNKRFCCDPKAINGVSWAIGKVLDARIIDSELGYFTDYVNLTISGQGYDVFPTMELKKAVTIKNIDSNVIVNNGSLVFGFVSTAPFRLKNYSIIHDGSVNYTELCDCFNQSFYYQNMPSGRYSIVVAVSDGINVFYESRNFTLVDYVRFERNITCNNCEGNRIPSNTLVNVTIYFDSSHDVYADLYDYFPKDWSYKGTESFIVGNTHNAVHWYIEGNSAQKSYALFSPTIRYPRKYSFYSGIESIKDNADIYLINPLFSFLSWFSFRADSLSMESKEIQFLNNLKNAPDKPIVLSIKDDFVSEIALFPKDVKLDSNIYFKKLKSEDKNSIYDFLIGSNIPDEELDYVFMKIHFNKKVISKQKINPKNVVVYFVDGNDLIEQEITKFFEENDSYYFEVRSSKTGKYKIMEKIS